MTWGKGRKSEAATQVGSESAPTGHPIEPLKTLLVATDLSARSDRAIQRAVELAGQHAARLVVLHVMSDNIPVAAQSSVAEAAKGEIQTCLTKAGGAENADVSIEVIRGDGYQDILERADAVGADLIVVGIHRNESGRKSITGTTMERVIRQGKHPVLVVPDQVDGPYKKVMIGVDFSVFSRVAIRSALALAYPAEFSIVHAYHVPFEGFQPGRETRQAVQDGHERELSRMIEDEMEALIESSTVDVSADLAIEKLVRNGETRSVVRKEIERNAPDLLVLGTHGRVGLSHAVLGSIAEDFLNDPPCDVLVVKTW